MNTMRNCHCCCRPIVTQTMPTCGVEVILDSDVCCARVCQTIHYTATIVNNACGTLNCVTLDLNVNPSLCIDTNTITLNGTPVENADPSCVNIGEIAQGAHAVVCFEATVMECKRYIRSKVLATYMVCCCCQAQCKTQPSNVDLVQVCCCCCCNNSMRAS